MGFSKKVLVHLDMVGQQILNASGLATSRLDTITLTASGIGPVTEHLIQAYASTTHVGHFQRWYSEGFDHDVELQITGDFITPGDLTAKKLNLSSGVFCDSVDVINDINVTGSGDIIMAGGQLKVIADATVMTDGLNLDQVMTIVSGHTDATDPHLQYLRTAPNLASRNVVTGDDPDWPLIQVKGDTGGSGKMFEVTDDTASFSASCDEAGQWSSFGANLQSQRLQSIGDGQFMTDGVSLKQMNLAVSGLHPYYEHAWTGIDLTSGITAVNMTFGGLALFDQPVTRTCKVVSMGVNAQHVGLNPPGNWVLLLVKNNATIEAGMTYTFAFGTGVDNITTRNDLDVDFAVGDSYYVATSGVVSHGAAVLATLGFELLE